MDEMGYPLLPYDLPLAMYTLCDDCGYKVRQIENRDSYFVCTWCRAALLILGDSAFLRLTADNQIKACCKRCRTTTTA
jgi:hypothetical protein